MLMMPTHREAAEQKLEEVRAASVDRQVHAVGACSILPVCVRAWEEWCPPPCTSDGASPALNTLDTVGGGRVEGAAGPAREDGEAGKQAHGPDAEPGARGLVDTGVGVWVWVCGCGYGQQAM